MISYLIENSWLLVVGAVFLHFFDYGLTIRGARLYAAQDHYKAEGSYELNPNFENDVNALNWISSKFLIRVGLATLLYVILAVGLRAYVESDNAYPEAARIIYNLIFGMVIGGLLVIIERHAFNIYLFRQLAKPGFAQGQIRYSRASTYSVSSAMLFIQAGSALIYCVLLGEAFFFGSAIMVWSLAQQHQTLGKRAAAEDAAVAAGEAPSPAEKSGRQLVRLLLLLVVGLVVTILILLGLVFATGQLN